MPLFLCLGGEKSKTPWYMENIGAVHWLMFLEEVTLSRDSEPSCGYNWQDYRTHMRNRKPELSEHTIYPYINRSAEN